jgi:TIR domain-containing protein
MKYKRWIQKGEDLMEKKIKKVFISYCQGDNDEFVINLAIKLTKNFNVIFDKWDLKYGNNILHFMEDSIRKADKVLIICDSEYSKRANSRNNGVGRETIMISPQVYKDMKQEKIIPIFLEGINVSPNYLKGILGIVIDDLSIISNKKIDEINNAILGNNVFKRPKNRNTNFENQSENKLIPKSKITLSLKEKIIEGIYDQDSFDKIMNTVNKGLLSAFLVTHQLNDFGEFVFNFDEENQIKILRSINSNYEIASKKWTDYDVFAEIAYHVGINSEYEEIHIICKSILSYCANYIGRYSAKPLLEELELKYL